MNQQSPQTHQEDEYEEEQEEIKTLSNIDYLVDYSYINSNELESISKIFEKINIQYNFESLKKCSKEILNGIDKQDSSIPNLEELILTIKTFKKLQTDIALMHSNPTLNSIIDYHAETILINGKLNFFEMIEQMNSHLLYIEDKELEELIPDLEQRDDYKIFVLGYVRSSNQISDQIIINQIYFHQALKKIQKYISDVQFVQRIQSKECSFCDPKNCQSIKEHQFLAFIKIIRRLIINLYEDDIILSNDCMEFLQSTQGLAQKFLERKCVDNLCKHLFSGKRNLYRKQYKFQVQSQSMTKFLNSMIED